MQNVFKLKPLPKDRGYFVIKTGLDFPVWIFIFPSE